MKINTDSLLIIFNKGRNIIKKENIKKKYFGYEQRRIQAQAKYLMDLLAKIVSDYFREKASLQMFDWVLKTSLMNETSTKIWKYVFCKPNYPGLLVNQ